LLQAVEIKKENKERREKTLLLLAFVYLASIARGSCRKWGRGRGVQDPNLGMEIESESAIENREFEGGANRGKWLADDACCACLLRMPHMDMRAGGPLFWTPPAAPPSSHP